MKPRVRSEANAPVSSTTHIPIPGFDPGTVPPGDKPRPAIPQWRRHRYGMHGMFGLVTSADLLYTIPLQALVSPMDIKVLHSRANGLKLGRPKGKASILYAVPVPATTADMKVYCRGVCVTVRQDFHPPKKSGQPAFKPMLGVRLWDGTKSLAYEAWPAAKSYSSGLNQQVVSAWFFRNSPPSEPLMQSLTVELAADFTVSKGTPLHFLEVRLVEVETAMLGY